MLIHTSFYESDYTIVNTFFSVVKYNTPKLRIKSFSTVYDMGVLIIIY